jgi:hypothetical protein
MTSAAVQVPKSLAWLVQPLIRPRLLLICTRAAACRKSPEQTTALVRTSLAASRETMRRRTAETVTTGP